jgi:hypothetical protein
MRVGTFFEVFYLILTADEKVTNEWFVFKFTLY